MSVYKFKVYFEDDESVSREIEIKSVQTFQDFHNIIQAAIGFDSLHPASFFISNDLWRKGKEVILMRKSHTAGLKGNWMHETKIASCVEDPHQKFIYEFDPEGGAWILHAELMKIIPEASVAYPRIGKTAGTSPAQYKITTPVMAPAEEEEDELLLDDAQDEYVHPEVAVPDHYHTTDEEEPVLMVKASEPEGEYKEEGMDGEEEEAESSDNNEDEESESFA